MKLTTTILAVAMVVGGSMATKAVAQTPDAIDNARSTAKSLQQTQANPAPTKPAPGAPAPAVKPAAIPGSKPVAAAKTASSASASSSSSSSNQLQHVSVVPGADGIAIEISSSQAVTPRVSKLNSPARIVVELPETVVASAQNKIPVGSAGVKGVRIGMDGKTPPTTSVVIDLEKPLAYELTPSAAGKVILTLHTQEAAPSVAKASPAPAAAVAIKTAAVKSASAKPAVVQTAAVPTASVKPAPAKAVAQVAATPTKVAVVKAAADKPAVQASKLDPKEQVKAAVASKTSAPAASESDAKASAAKATKPEEKKWAMSGKRDPFFSPVVQQNGSGCSTGKKCLEIGAINLRGVVKSDNGFIAVVTNNLNKAYFLRENDPVFNGYVVKITGDSVVFQETIQDKLGKSFTREVVKRIFTPAV
jgi:Tfp pilus assembly protein PilP